MSKHIGSQFRETLEETDYKVVSHVKSNPHISGDRDTVVLQDTDTGVQELWVANNDHAGWTVEIDGVGYEFVRSC
jgi:hypothetical protein